MVQYPCWKSHWVLGESHRYVFILKDNKYKHLTAFTSSLDMKTWRDPSHRHGPKEGRLNAEAVKKEDAWEDLSGEKKLSYGFIERQK